VICDAAGPPSGGLYLKPPSSGGLWEGVTTMPAALVMHENRAGERRRRGVAAARVHQHAHVVGGQHLQRGDEGRLGQGVGVAADEQRAGDARPGPVVADRLRRGGDVVLVEGQPQRRPAVAGGAERHPLPGLVRVGVPGVVGGDERRHVDQVGSGGWLARPFVRFHASPPGRRARRTDRAPEPPVPMFPESVRLVTSGPPLTHNEEAGTARPALEPDTRAAGLRAVVRPPRRGAAPAPARPRCGAAQLADCSTGVPVILPHSAQDPS